MTHTHLARFQRHSEHDTNRRPTLSLLSQQMAVWCWMRKIPSAC